VKTEIKNLNSFRAVYRGIQYEVERQIELLRRGEQVTQETRGWNDAKGRTYAQRSKEEAHDYRYFPEPDLVPMHLTRDWVESIRAQMPELPDAARERFERTYGLSRQDADMLTQDRATADFFESAAVACGDPKAVANWMMGDFARLLNAADMEIGASRVTPHALAEMIGLLRDGTISGKMAKGIFEEMFRTGARPAELAAAAGPQVRDAGEIAAIIDGVLSEQAEVWSALCAGDEKKFGYLIGQVMKASQGKANPQEANRLLRERLEEARRRL